MAQSITRATKMLLEITDRIITEEQHLDMQLTALRKAGCKKIFQEKMSGTKWERPEVHKTLDSLKPGDVVVVWIRAHSQSSWCLSM